MNENNNWSGLYHRTRTGLKLKAIKQFKEAFRIGDKVYIPVPKGEASFRPNYEPVCTVVEIHDHYITVDHGTWKEAIQYVDILTEASHDRVIMADSQTAREFDSLTEQYWRLRDLAYGGQEGLSERMECLEERLDELEPLVDCRERFIGLRGSQDVSRDCDSDWRRYDLSR